MNIVFRFLSKKLNHSTLRIQLVRIRQVFTILVFLASLIGTPPAVVKAAGEISFSGQELLGRPTDTSIAVKVVPDANIDLYYEYGTSSGDYSDQTAQGSATGGQPYEAVISELTPDTLYYYRMQYSADGGSTWTARPEHSFRTQRAAGDGFTFTITSDSHVNVGGLGNGTTWTQTMTNVANEHPDFEIDLGDTFGMDSVTTAAGADSVYLAQRQYFDLVGNSSSIFLVPGNHEEQEAWHLDDTGNPATSLPVLGANAEKKYYLNPVPDSFYSGDTDPYSYLSGDHLRQDYYSWTWGDALFVVIDPYWFTTTKPFTGNTGGGESSDTGSGDRWDWTLGLTQFNWLKTTLQNSTAKYKFVFAHHMVGGSDDYVRGGANPANIAEWGGYNENGTTWGWDTHRPVAQWGSEPVHQILMDNHVSAFFHGHDHQYAYEKRDGIVYQSLPSAGFSGNGFSIYTTGSGYTIQALPSPGHLRVTVGPAQATVDYVATSGGAVNYSYAIDATSIGPTQALTTAVSPSGGGTINPAAGTHTYNQGDVVTVTATPNSGYTFASWGGDCSGSGTCSITMDADKTVTANFTALPTYILTTAVSLAGGGSISPVAGPHTYNQGDVATVTATPNSGYTFSGWEGDCTGTDACSVTMDADKSVTANFAADPIGGITYIGDIGSNTIKDSGNANLVVTTTADVEAGDDIIIAYATDPSQDLTIGISDPAGNKYQQAAMGISVGSMRTYVFAAYNVTALPSGSAITIHQTVVTSTAVAARAAVVSVFRGLAPVGALEQTNVGSQSAGTTPSSGAATTIQANQLLIGVVGTEGPGTDNAGTWQNSFTAGPRAGTTATTTDAEITVSMGWQIVSAAGSYTAAKSGITQRDSATAIATFKTTDAGISYIGDIGSAQTKASAGTSLAVTTNAAVAAGDDILVTFALDGNSGSVSVSDGTTNVYNQVVNAQFTTPGNTNVRTVVFAAYNLTALPSGSTITITHPSVTARSAVVSVFRGLADSAVLDQTHTATGTTTAVSSGATSATTQADELLIGALGLEGPNYDAPSVWQNSFTYGPRMGTNYGSGSGGGDTDVTAQTGWRIVRATSAYTAQIVNLNTARDWAAAIATLKYGPSTVTHDLTVAVAPSGGGTTNPAVGVHTYAGGTIVPVTATANTGYVFSNWSGACTGSGACSVTMDADRTVTANFTVLPTYVLTTAVSPSGGGTIDPAAGTHTYNQGDVVTVTATASAGYTFNGWSGACTGSGACSVTMNADKTVTANFAALLTHVLTTAVSPSGGGTINPAAGTHTYNQGDVVTVTATHNTGYVFSSWSGACTGTGTCSVTMDADKTVTANFSIDPATITFTGSELLGRPESNSISVSIVPDSGISLRYLYGTTSGGPYSNTSTVAATGGQPKVVVIDGLTPNTKYYYRTQFSTDGGSTWTARPEHSFYTQRATGSTYTFTVTSDGHVNIMLGNATTWTNTLNDVAADHPDFAIDLGDTVAMDDVSVGDVAEAEGVYKDELPFFNRVSASSPIFLVAGNHEQQEGWHLLNPLGSSLPVLGTNAQKKFFLDPVPDSFYTGDTSTYSYLDGDHLRQDYYAWTWGDALFVVIDPYWFSTTKPYVTDPGGGETDTTGSGDSWDWTLGQDQFNWLKTTLQNNSSAKYKFVFAHQMVGGGNISGQADYGHGGANYANLVEWGGYNENGTTWGWDTKRPGWGSQPIHQMMVANGVSAFFHGHDHQYAYEKLDGVVYQAVPAGGFTGNGFSIYTTGSGNTIRALPSSGHLRVTVAPSQTTVDYIQTSTTTPAYTYTIAPASSTHVLTTAVSPSGGGTISPAAGTHTYNHGDVVAVTASANTGYTFSGWSGACSGTGTCQVTMTADKTVTATFAINTYTLTYTPGAHGSITGASPQTVDHGTNGTAVTAVPVTGYHFVNWSDLSTANPRTDTNVTGNISVTATFAINTYTLTYTPGAHGSISGASPQTVDYGTNGTAVTAVPATGYHFVNWSDLSTANPRTDSNVTANISVTATFAINTYTLTYTPGAHGSITGASPQTVDHGTNGTAVTAVPVTGYHFVNWSDLSTANPRTDTNVTGNISVTATFAINTYTLTYTPGAHGSITGASPQTVDYGTNGTAVTAVPATGYHFVDWSDGFPNATRTDVGVTEDISVTATFASSTYTISGSTVAGATLNYAGDTSGSTEADASGAYSISVSSGWNGTVTPSFAGCTFSPTDETYSNVTADLTGEDYAATCSMTVKSVAANDGWVLESGENTNAGGSMDSAATTINLGDDAANKQYRGILSFNTSTLPGNAVIDSVQLRIKKSGVVGSDPFSSLGKIMVDMKKGTFSNNPTLQKGDFQAAASQSNAAVIKNTLVNGWYKSGSFGSVNPTGTTQFRLGYQTDDNNNHVAEYLQIYSGNAAASSRPQLVITYHTP